jgi:hypothetical protein
VSILLFDTEFKNCCFFGSSFVMMDSIDLNRLANVELEDWASSLKLIELQVLLFNLNFSTFVQVIKLCGLTGSIIGGFGAVKLMNSNVPFALVFGVFFVEGNVLYSLISNEAHKIPERVNELKFKMVVGSRKKEVTRVVRSIPELGIRAGSFNVMEREATLIFVDYSLRQILSLLLAF